MLLFLNFTIFLSFFLPISFTSPKTQAPLRASPKNFQLNPEEGGQKAPQIFDDKSDRLKTSLL